MNKELLVSRWIEECPGYLHVKFDHGTECYEWELEDLHGNIINSNVMKQTQSLNDAILDACIAILNEEVKV